MNRCVIAMMFVCLSGTGVHSDQIQVYGWTV